MLHFRLFHSSLILKKKKTHTLLLYIMADLKAADILLGVYKTHSEVFLIHGLLWLSSLYPVNGYASGFQKVDSTYINLIYNYFNHTERNQFWGYYAHKYIKFTINFYLLKLGEIQHGHTTPSLIIYALCVLALEALQIQVFISEI